MDSQVKERIVGAAVLVALGVWLIPLVLNGPADSRLPADAASGALLPAAEEGEPPVRTETVELDPRRVPAERAAGADGGDGVADAASTDAAVGTPAADSSEPAAGTAGTAAGRTAAERSAAEAPAADVAPPPADAAPDVTPAPAGWTVQVGAFSELANARRQADRVDDFGYAASVSPTESAGGTLYRVRVGGFDTEVEAEAARSSLSAHGFVGKTYPPE